MPNSLAVVASSLVSFAMRRSVDIGVPPLAAVGDAVTQLHIFLQVLLFYRMDGSAQVGTNCSNRFHRALDD